MPQHTVLCEYDVTCVLQFIVWNEENQANVLCNCNCCESSNNVHEITTSRDMTVCIFVTTQQSRRGHIPENQNLHQCRCTTLNLAIFTRLTENRCSTYSKNQGKYMNTLYHQTCSCPSQDGQRWEVKGFKSFLADRHVFTYTAPQCIVHSLQRTKLPAAVFHRHLVKRVSS